MEIIFWLLFCCIFAPIFMVQIVNCAGDEHGNDQLIISFNQIGEFVEAVREPFFTQIVTDGHPSVASAENGTDGEEEEGEEHWTDTLGNKMIHTGVLLGTIELFRAINSRVNDVGPIIAEMVQQQIDMCQQQNQQKEMMVKVAKAQLSVRQLIKMTKRIVLNKILHQFRHNALERTKLCKWWYRFRYNVADSAVYFVDDDTTSAIHLGVFQYYMSVHDELNKLIAQFDQRHTNMANILSILDGNWAYMQFVMRTNSAEQTDFDPSRELPREKFDVLMHNPANKEVAVEVFCEKFPHPYNIGTVFQALGINHRGVKVYDIEFHFGCNEGVIIGENIRKRVDPKRGIKFHHIGWTNKSPWEVQKIFDHFNDFYMENERFEEGKFSTNKYDILKNNCIDFSREFVEALLEGDGRLKSKHWPPKVLRQPPINDKSCGLSSCFVPANLPDDDEPQK